MRIRVVAKPWLPSPAGDLAHRKLVDAVTHCCRHSILQESGTAYCTYGAVVGKQTAQKNCSHGTCIFSAIYLDLAFSTCRIVPFTAGIRVWPGSMAAALRATLSRLGALKRFAVSRHSFGAGLLYSARPHPDPCLAIERINQHSKPQWRCYCNLLGLNLMRWRAGVASRNVKGARRGSGARQRSALRLATD